MNSKGRIVKVRGESTASLWRRGLVPIPEKYLARVEGMSSEERRAWYQARKVEHRRKQRGGLSSERRANKRARKARRRNR